MVSPRSRGSTIVHILEYMLRCLLVLSSAAARPGTRLEAMGATWLQPSDEPSLVHEEKREELALLHTDEAEDMISCVGNSTCNKVAFLVAGNASSEEVVIFLHTAFDAGWAPYVALFDGWNPPFYAIALDMPGELTVPPSKHACVGMGFGCQTGWDETIEWVRRAVSRVAPVGRRISFVAHSMGGHIAQEYVRRHLEPRPGKLVLLSNPTDPVWAQSSLNKAGASCKNRTSWVDPVPGSVDGAPAPGVVGPRGKYAQMVRTAGNAHRTYSYENPIANALFQKWLGSPNYNASMSWFEGYTDFTLYEQCNGTRPQIPHKIIYARGRDGRLAWPDLQPAAETACAMDPRCTFEAVTIPSASYSCGDPLPSSNCSGQNAGRWGHWVHVDHPAAVRAAVESYLVADEGNGRRTPLPPLTSTRLLPATMRAQPAEMQRLWLLVKANEHMDLDDAFWSATHDALRNSMQASQPNAMHNANAGYHAFTAAYCLKGSTGQTLVASEYTTKPVKADAFFCGSTTQGIDWTSLTGQRNVPLRNICKDRVGEAYSPTGACGSYSKKELLLNWVQTTHLWATRLVLQNIMSVDCIYGDADSDVFYCQSCPGLCDDYDVNGQDNETASFLWKY